MVPAPKPKLGLGNRAPQPLRCLETNTRSPHREESVGSMPSPAHPFLDKDRRKIRTLFDNIAHRYDFLNHLLSFNLDRRWRRRAIEALGPVSGGTYLDVCCGTGDVAFELEKRHGDDVRVIASDFSVPMLQGGVQKRRRLEQSRPYFLAGDTLHLPFAPDSFDGVTVSFGIRNVENFEGGAGEVARVLRPGGRFVILEFTPLRNRVLRPFFNLYCHGIVPFIGNLVSGSRERAYSYLQQSIDRWPAAPELADRLRAVGFSEVEWSVLFPGNVAMHCAVK